MFTLRFWHTTKYSFEQIPAITNFYLFIIFVSSWCALYIYDWCVTHSGIFFVVEFMNIICYVFCFFIWLSWMMLLSIAYLFIKAKLLCNKQAIQPFYNKLLIDNRRIDLIRFIYLTSKNFAWCGYKMLLLWRFLDPCNFESTFFGLLIFVR